LEGGSVIKFNSGCKGKHFFAYFNRKKMNISFFYLKMGIAKRDFSG